MERDDGIPGVRISKTFTETGHDYTGPKVMRIPFGSDNWVTCGVARDMIASGKYRDGEKSVILAMSLDMGIAGMFFSFSPQDARDFAAGIIRAADEIDAYSPGE